MSILLGIALLTIFLSVAAFILGNSLLHIIGMVLTVILVFMAMCFEGHTLGRIQRLEKELDKLRRNY